MTGTPVIDAHHHFWDPETADYPWMTEELAAIRRRFDASDLRPLLAANAVDRTVLVQTRSSLDETREFLADASESGFVAGVVGWIDLTDPAVADTIAEIRARPGGALLVGVRHQVHDEADPDWLARADVRRGLRAVAEAGLVYDLLSRTRELPACLAVARALPELTFVLDHCAKPPIAARDQAAMAAWAEGVAALAECPNVWCKLSGLVTEADWAHWTVEDLRPTAAHVLDRFGPERLIFGSDWPVSLLAAPYHRVKSAAQTLLAGLSDTEREGVFGGNAIAAYRLRV